MEKVWLVFRTQELTEDAGHALMSVCSTEERAKEKCSTFFLEDMDPTAKYYTEERKVF